MLVPEHARETLVGLYRENSRFSRDLVGRAVVLDGGSLGSGDLGPATLFFPAGKLSGRGRGACPGRREPCLRAPSRPRRRPRLCCADGPSGCCAPRRPPPAESCPAGLCPSAAPPSAVVPDSFCPVTLFLKHSFLVYFSVACGCGVFPQSPKRKPSISACVRASLSDSLDH